MISTTSRLESIAGFVAEHGFEATVAGDVVVVVIPGWIPATGERVEVRYEVQSMAEARGVLGY